MSNNFCQNCGNQVSPEDRFCENCGFQISPRDQAAPAQPPRDIPSRDIPPSYTATKPRNKKPGVFIVSILVLAVIFAGGFYWWISRDKGDEMSDKRPGTIQEEDKLEPAESDPSPSEELDPVLDLTKASTYLSNPGLNLTFFVNYPDGQSGIVNRISSRVVDHESVKVTELELGIERGEEFGFGSHFVERVDGTYVIYDFIPDEISPILKNNLTIGSTWDYVTEYGDTIWTVVDMGVTLDLDFAIFHNCIIVREENQAVGFQSLSYYSPGFGIIYVVSPEGEFEYYRVTEIDEISEDEAKEKIIQWCPNYIYIKDDRTQS